MSNLTGAERDELHHAVLRDVLAAGETVPNVHATAESILAARVQAERDRLLARIEAYADLLTEQGDAHVPGCVGQADCAACVAADLRALVAEERAR